MSRTLTNAVTGAAAILLGIAVPPAARAETAAEKEQMRSLAIDNCKSNRGVDCESEAGLREWVELEKKRPPGQRATLLQQKLEAERRAKQRAEEAARKREAEAAARTKGQAK